MFGSDGCKDHCAVIRQNGVSSHFQNSSVDIKE